MKFINNVVLKSYFFFYFFIHIFILNQINIVNKISRPSSPLKIWWNYLYQSRMVDVTSSKLEWWMLLIWNETIIIHLLYYYMSSVHCSSPLQMKNQYKSRKLEEIGKKLQAQTLPLLQRWHQVNIKQTADAWTWMCS